MLAKLAALNLDSVPPASLSTHDIKQAQLGLGVTLHAFEVYFEEMELMRADRLVGSERLRTLDAQRIQLGQRQEALRSGQAPTTPPSIASSPTSRSDHSGNSSPKDGASRGRLFRRRPSRSCTSESAPTSVAHLSSILTEPSVSPRSLGSIMAVIEGVIEGKAGHSAVHSARDAALRARLVLQMWLLTRMRNEDQRVLQPHYRGQSMSSQATGSADTELSTESTSLW